MLNVETIFFIFCKEERRSKLRVAEHRSLKCFLGVCCCTSVREMVQQCKTSVLETVGGRDAQSAAAADHERQGS